VVSNKFDSLLRRTNLVTLKSGILTSNLFSYDPISRLQVVSDGTNSATYGYLTNSGLVSNIVFQQSGTTRMTTTKVYDNLNRLTSISSTTNASAAYAYNNANQRTSVTNADGAYWVYQYDALGQVTGGIKHWADGSVVAGQH
jgi:YD repeat-containing protein